MTSDLIPIATASGIVQIGHETEGWNLADGEGAREFVFRVDFEIPFGSAPVIQAALSGFDLDQRFSARISVVPENMSPEGFDLVVRTWDDTRVYGVEGSWLAVGS